MSGGVTASFASSGGAGSVNASLLEAAARLEAAVERLATAAARPPRPTGVPPEEVAELSRRLDATIARLRLALRDGEVGGEGDEPADGLSEGPGDEAAPAPRREG